MRSTIKFLWGVSLLAVDTLLQWLTHYQTLAFLQVSAPSAYALLSGRAFAVTLLVVALAFIIHGCIGIWKSRISRPLPDSGRVRQSMKGSPGGRMAGGDYYETHNTTINSATNGRNLESWQKVSVIGHLKQACFNGAAVTVVAHGEKESMNYAAQLLRVLADCGWSPTGPYLIPLTVHFWDIQISTDNHLREHATAAALYDALAKARLRCKPGYTLDGNVMPNQIVLWVGVEGPAGSQPGTNNPPLHFDPSWIRPRESRKRPIRFVLGGFER